MAHDLFAVKIRCYSFSRIVFTRSALVAAIAVGNQKRNARFFRFPIPSSSVPATRRPEVFISATTADLRSCRQLIKEALLTLHCVPVEQPNFPPDYRSVREMLRARIAACDAVIHLAGEIYGAEPTERAPGEPRRSYTQLEYDLARDLAKPVYVFVCGPAFPYDDHAPRTPSAHSSSKIASGRS